jgi:hypothetical protein
MPTNVQERAFKGWRVELFLDFGRVFIGIVLHLLGDLFHEVIVDERIVSLQAFH